MEDKLRINFLYRKGLAWPHSMGEGFINALRQLGHEVSVFLSEKDSGYQVNQYKPLHDFIKTPCDLFIAMGGGDKYCAFYYDTPARKELMNLKVPKLAYYMEGMNSRTLTKMKYEVTTKLWTHILTCDETDVKTLKKLGCKNVCYTPGWVDEKMFCPKDVPIKYEFQFIGYVQKHREPYVRFFEKELGMNVGKYETTEDYVNGINETKVLMGLPTIIQGFPQRVSETLACGKVLLHKRPPNEFPICQQLFKDREQIVFYDTVEEAVELAKYYSKHDKERCEIEVNAREEILKKHTILIRAKEFVDYANHV